MRFRSTRRDHPAAVSVGKRYYDSSIPWGDGPWTLQQEYLYPTVPAPEPDPRYEKWIWDELHPGPPYRTGGPLGIYEFSTDERTPKGGVDVICPFGYRYVGGFLPTSMPSQSLGYGSLDVFKESGDCDVSAYGAVGWNRFRPTRSPADLAVFLGEIKDVPRMLKTTAKAFKETWKAMGGSLRGFGPKKVAQNWLNTQFGWIPFLSDLRKFHATTQNLSQRIAQLRRDNGHWIRRGGTVTTDSSVEMLFEQSSPGLWPGISTWCYDGPPYGSGRMDLSYSRHVWFEGRFRYYMPSVNVAWKWNPRAVAHLYGAMPSPSLIWELTPWSWLIDWCSNVGDVIANVSSIGLDGLCAKHAYIMGTTSKTATWTGTANFKGVGPVTYSWSASYTGKSRSAASPFGFGLTSDMFSVRQWSILSALGLTRLR